MTQNIQFGKTCSSTTSSPEVIGTENNNIQVEGEWDGELEKQQRAVQQDGGYGWFVVAGSFICVFQFSYLFCKGVMINMLEDNVFGISKDITMQLTFVGTIAAVLTQACAPFSRLLEATFGSKSALIIATALYCVGMVSAGFARQIWQLYLSLGICCGMAASIFWSVSYRVTAQWFTKRRGLAMGIISSGTGASGLIMPFVMSAINSSLNTFWIFHILAIAFIVLDTNTCILVRENPVEKQRQKSSKMPIINWRVLKNHNFLIWVAACIPQALVTQLPFQIVPAYAIYFGQTEFRASTLISIMAAINIIGRILQGYVADIIGNLNTLILSSIMCALGSFFIWTFAFSYEVLLAYVIISGIFSGAFYVVAAPTVACIVGMEDLPSGNTLLWVMTSPALFGPSIASVIEANTAGRPFLTYQLLVGLAFTISILITLILKLRLDRTIFSKT
ncbi:major facilitator superfamily domain-containing protein [Fennellomyces sp. T-0311]|nr:major facilitator superfamily domain-containing protein [Fennellomyces sp. T-0311]